MSARCRFRFEIPGYLGSALSISSGFLLAFAFPKFELPGIMWFALVPLFFAIDRSPSRRVFTYAWLQGFVFFLVILHPIVFALTTYGHASYPSAVTKLLVLAAIEALAFGAAFSVEEFISSRVGISRTIVLPITWVAFEFARSYVPVGFPWALLGYAAHRDIALIQFVELTGIYGVSALIILVNATLYRLLDSSQNLAGKILEAVPAASIIALALVFGWERITQIDAMPRLGALRVALVQADIPQSLKWKQSNLEPTFQIYSHETLSASQEHPDLVIWPEAAIPFVFLKASDYSDGPLRFHQAYHDRLLRLVRDAQQPLLFGAPALDFSSGISTRNRVYLLSASGNVVGYYDKMILVPFDEYVPLAGLFGRLFDKPVESVGPIMPGSHQTILPIKDARLGVLICYESIFPALSRRAVQAGAQILVNLSNDAWFGNTSFPYQLLAMATMRALENRTVMIRVANTGISAIVSPTGRIIDAIRLSSRITKSETVSWIATRTFYTKYGDLFAGGCLAATLVGMVTALAFTKNAEEHHS